MRIREIMIIVLFVFVLVMVYVIDVWKGTERADHFAATNNTQQISKSENNQTKE